MNAAPALCFLIRKWDQGGAQRQLLELLRALGDRGYRAEVFTFYAGGLFSEEAARLPGVRTHSLAKCGRWDTVGFYFRLIARLRAARPNVLHSYQGMANILAVAAKPFLPRTRVVWGVRNARRDRQAGDRLRDLEFSLQRRLSRYADLIIANSRAGLRFYAAQGFPGANLRFIPNGTDTERFRPDPAAGAEVRKEFGLEGAPVIGVAARLHPVKGIEDFLAAAARIRERLPECRFLVIGGGEPRYRERLASLADDLGFGRALIWAGERGDIVRCLNAVDVLVSASQSEGFPNALCEAMACGVPCVATDVGDSADILGGSGRVVPSRDTEAMARECLALLAEGAGPGGGEARTRLRRAARDRIVAEFSVDRLVRETLEALCPKA